MVSLILGNISVFGAIAAIPTLKLGSKPSTLNPIVLLKQIEYGFGYSTKRSPCTPRFYLLKGLKGDCKPEALHPIFADWLALMRLEFAQGLAVRRFLLLRQWRKTLNPKPFRV